MQEWFDIKVPKAVHNAILTTEVYVLTMQTRDKHYIQTFAYLIYGEMRRWLEDIGSKFCTTYCRIPFIFLSSSRYLLYLRENNKSDRYLSMVYLGFNRSSTQLLVLEFIVFLHCLDYFKQLSKIHFCHKCVQRYTKRNTRESVP